jgi:hypothetical protein
MTAVAEINDEIDPDNEPETWPGSFLDDSEFERLAGFGIDTSSAAYDALNWLKGWEERYQGPKTRSGAFDAETPFEKARAGAYTGELVRLLDREVNKRLSLKVGDAVISPGGGSRPVVTDPNDMIMALKAGGPLANALGGGGGTTNFYFNINGDKAQMYREIMRALKATGNA